MNEENSFIVEDDEKCCKCNKNALSTYKQVIIHVAVVEEGSIYDSGQRYVLCDDCRKNFYDAWAFFQKQTA